MSSPEAEIIPHQMWGQFQFDKSFRPEALMKLQQQFVGALQNGQPTPIHALQTALKAYADIRSNPDPNTTLVVSRDEMPRDHAITIRESTFSIDEDLLSFLEITHSYPSTPARKGLRRYIENLINRDKAHVVQVQHTYAVKRLGAYGKWQPAGPNERLHLQHVERRQPVIYSAIELAGVAPVWPVSSSL